MPGIPMLQGWFDQLKPGLDNIVGTLPDLINPDKKIQDALQAELVRNPKLIEQISNMTPEQKNALIQGLGFRNPAKHAGAILNTPEGFELKGKRRTEAAIEETDKNPIQRAFRVAKDAGTKTEADLKAEEKDTEQRQAINKNTIDEAPSIAEERKQRIDANKIKFAQLQRDEDEQIKAIKMHPDLADIDIASVANKLSHGQNVAPDILTRIENSSSATAFKQLMETSRDKIAHEYAVDEIALRKKDPSIMHNEIALLDRGVDNLKVQLDQAEKGLAQLIKDHPKIKYAGQLTDPKTGKIEELSPEDKKLLDAANTAVADKKAKLKVYNDALENAMKVLPHMQEVVDKQDKNNARARADAIAKKYNLPP